MDDNKLTMDENEEIYILIDQYLTNQLSESDRREFERRCSDDSVFAEEVKLHAQAEYASRSYAREQKKQDLKALFAEKSTETTTVRNMQMLRWVAAAAIVLLAIVGFYRYFSSSNQTLPELYAANVETETFSLRRSPKADSINAHLWEEAANAFNSQEYEIAIRGMDFLLNDSTFDSRPKAHLYMGLSYLFAISEKYRGDFELEDIEEFVNSAVSEFEQVAPESSFIEKAQWYTALAWLKADNREKAIEALEVVKNYPNHFRKSKAEALLNQLASSP